MILKSVHLTTKLVSILSILILLAIASSIVWVISEPRSLSALTPHVEDELNTISDDYKFKISESYIKWDNKEKSFVIDISDVDIVDKNDAIIANFPQISFDFSMINFFQGNIISSDLTLTNPTFNIDTSKILYSQNTLPDRSDIIENTISLQLKQLFNKNNYNFPISTIRIKNAELFINNGSSEFVWHIMDGYLSINASNTIISELNINLGKDTTYLGISISTNESDTIDTSVKFKDLPTYVYADLFPKVEIFNNINIISDGDLKFLISDNGYVSQLQFNIDKAIGNFTFLDIFKEKINFDSLTISGSFYDHFSTVTINKFNIKIYETELSMSATVHNIQDSFPDLSAKVDISNFQISNLDKYWPLKLGTIVREWVTNNINEGVVTSATGKFIFNAEDFEAIKKWKNSKSKDFVPLKSDSIVATINVEDAKVKFHDDYPDFNNVKATVIFSGTSLDAQIEEANILESSINTSKLEIINMWTKPTHLNIDGNFNGTTKDAVSILKIPLNKLDTSKELEHIYAASGQVSGNIKLSLPIEKELKYDDIDIQVSSSFSKNKIPQLINGNDVSNADFNLNFKNNKLDITGIANILESRLSFIYEHDIKTKNKSYKINGDINNRELETLKIAKIPFLQEKFNVDIHVQDTSDKKHVTGNLNLTNSIINIEQLGFKKNINVASKLTFDLEQHPGQVVNINKFTIEGTEISASGNMLIKNSNLVSFNLNNVKFGNNNFNTTYSNINNNYVVQINGKSLDLKNAAFGKLTNNLKSNSKKYSLLINTNIEKIFMKNDAQLFDLKSNIVCTNVKCTTVNLHSKTIGDGFLSLTMKPLADRSIFMLESNNAGIIIKSLGISKHIQSGSLTVESTFSNDYGITAQGLIQIRDFTAMKTPLLGKLLTLASLQGISDRLNNNGIHFERFTAPFVMSNNIITLKDVKTAGSSIGITSRGTVDLNNEAVDLKGAIVPAYMVNKLLGNLPIVGQILVGNKNEGIIATTYRINGPYENTKVTVNPLTILTPGFLRNIFDIF